MADNDPKPRPDATATIDPLDHQGLVHSIARRYVGRGLDLDDLVSAGQIGLLRACSDYDSSRGVAFSTLATIWIRQQIGHAIRDQANTIRVPKYLFDQNRSSRARVGTQADAKRARGTVGEGGLADGPGLHALALDPDYFVPESDIDAGQIRAAIASLDPRSATVVRLLFGIDCEPHTLRETGKEVGVCYERVRQIKVEALRALSERIKVA